MRPTTLSTFSLFRLLLITALITAATQFAKAEEPVVAMTLEQSQALPTHEAMAIDVDRLFSSIASCAYPVHTYHSWQETAPDGAQRLAISLPMRTHSWFLRQPLPVSLEAYPIVELDYRAENIHKIEIGSYQKRHVFTPSEPGPDGTRRLRLDTRDHDLFQSWPKDTLIRVTTGPEGEGSIDLVGLRYIADPENAPEPAVELAPKRIRVTDIEGHPIAGVKVSTDAYRLNFARSADTDAHGVAEVTPLSSERGINVIRVEKDGWVTAEFVQYGVGSDGMITVKMSKAVIFQGQVVDEYGAGIAGASVRMYPAYARTPEERKHLSQMGHRQTSLSVVTDVDGRWQSPPMPAETSNMCLMFAHKDYVSDTSAHIEKGHTIDELIREHPVRTMKSAIVLTGNMKDAETQKPIQGAYMLVVLEGEMPWQGGISRPPVLPDGTYITRGIEVKRGKLLAIAPGYASQLIPLNPDKAGEHLIDLDMELGREVTGRLLSADGQPVANIKIGIALDDTGLFFDMASTTDAEGNWTYKNAPKDRAFTVYQINNRYTKLFMSQPFGTIEPDQDSVDLVYPLSVGKTAAAPAVQPAPMIIEEAVPAE